MGRKYSPSEAHLEAVEQMAHKGVAHSKMAKALGISLATFKRNLNHFELYIKKGKERVDQEAVDKEIALVEKSLLKRCLGYEYEEKVIETRQNSNGESQIVHQKITKKRVQPSDGAIFYYLGNRTNGKWKSVNYANNDETQGTGITREETLEWMNQATVGKELVN